MSMSYRWLSGAMGPHWNNISNTAQHHSLVKTSGVSRKVFFSNQGKGGVMERGGMDGGGQDQTAKLICCFIQLISSKN